MLGKRRSPVSVSMVPISPHAPSSRARISRSIQAVVVFPFVPVIPMTRRCSAGYPQAAADMAARAHRVSATRITVTLGGQAISFDATMAAAPFSTASGTNLCPSVPYPSMQT